MRRNWARARGRNFFAAGWGKHGPYFVATRRVRRRIYAKLSIGILGPRVGAKYSGRRASVEGLLSLPSGRPSFSFKRKRRQRKS